MMVEVVAREEEREIYDPHEESVRHAIYISLFLNNNRFFYFYILLFCFFFSISTRVRSRRPILKRTYSPTSHPLGAFTIYYLRVNVYNMHSTCVYAQNPVASNCRADSHPQLPGLPIGRRISYHLLSL